MRRQGPGHRQLRQLRQLGARTYHDTCTDCDAPAAVGVRHDVTEADTQERDRDQPHRVQQVGVLFIVKPDWFRA